MADINPGSFKQVYVTLLGAFLFLHCGLPVSLAANSDISLLSQQRPAETLCRAPVYWFVDEIDPRFGFTRSEVTTAAIRAAEIWNQAAKTELFTVTESEGDAIRISLVYDHRQQLQEHIAESDAKVARFGEQVTELDASLANERARLEASRQQVDKMSERIVSRAAEAEDMISQHTNRDGQVSRRAAEQINAFQAQTQQMVNVQNAEVDEFNRRLADFNTRVNMRNRLAEEQNSLVSLRNQSVQNHEAEWQRRGLDTEAGRHNIQIRTSRGRVSVVDEMITIYSASNDLGLVTILAHEFGHAIGINHVQGATSIMAERIESQAPGIYPQTLSNNDVAALEMVCDLAN